MDILLFVIMICLFGYISVKNITLIKRYKHNKKYIACYQNVFHEKENCKDDLDLYIESEKSDEYKNKAKIIKLYYELNNGLDFKDTINDIDFKAIYYSKGVVDKNQLKYNSDSIIFMMMCFAKAYEVNSKDAIELFCKKTEEYKELEIALEYNELLALAKALTNTDDKGSAFLRNILDGAYTEFLYDKNMIGLYKRIAASTLIFNMEEVDEYFRNDLHSFANTFVGEHFLKSLGLFDIYKVEEPQQEVAENIEDKGEDNSEDNNEQ